MPWSTLIFCLVLLCNSGDTLGSVVYVPCEVMKQRMQVQGTRTSWSSVKPGMQMYGYYTGMFQAGCSIWKEQGPKGLYAGYLSDYTLYFFQLCDLLSYKFVILKEAHIRYNHFLVMLLF